MLRVEPATSPAEACRYFTDSSHTTAWLGPEVSSDPRPGGTCRCGSGTGERVRARFLHLVPGELPLTEWHYEREAPLRQGTGSAAGRPSDPAADPATEPGSNRVIVIFRPAAAGTQVEVRHLSYVPGSAHFYQTAWAECLARLQAAAGPAGR